MDLEELLRAARDEERGAWRALHGELTRELRWQLGRWFEGDRLDDMVVEVVTAVAKQLPGFVPHTSLRAWVRGIAHNCAMDELRRKYAEADLLHELVREPTPSQTSMDSKLLRREFGRLVEAEREKLPAKLREALEHGWSGGDDGELAAREGVSVAAIRTRRHRALQQLRRGIEGRLAQQGRLADGRLLAGLLPARAGVGDSPSPSSS